MQDGLTALTLAARKGFLNVVQLLLRNGANANCKANVSVLLLALLKLGGILIGNDVCCSEWIYSLSVFCEKEPC